MVKGIYVHWKIVVLDIELREEHVELLVFFFLALVVKVELNSLN